MSDPTVHPRSLRKEGTAEAKYGAAVVGCGWVSEEYIKAFLHDGRAETRALVARTAAKAEAYKAKYALDCTIGADLAAVVARDDIDIVVVATPHDRHTDYVVAAAEAGKHVVIEKPVALTMGDVRRQLAAVRGAGGKSIVSFVLHWNPLLMTIDQLIRDGAFGNVFMVEVDYLHRIWLGSDHWLGTKKSGGTSILAGGCHAVDAMRWFARSEAVEVAAYQVKTENPIEYPGTLTAVVKFADGKVGRTTSCFDANMPYVFNVSVYGTEGSIRNDKVFAPKVFPGQNGFMTIPCVMPDSGDVAHHPFRGEVAHFLDCIDNNTRPFPDLEDAAHTTALCIAADLSAQEGRTVEVAYVWNS